MSTWYYAVDSQQFGPVEESTLRDLIAKGTLGDTAVVWRKGFADWLELSQVPELRTVIAPETKEGVLLESDEGDRFEIREGQTTLGRGDENDIVIPSRFVSVLHAIFENQGGQVWLTDLGSRNGTYHNGTRLFADERVALAPGDQVRITGKGRLMRVRGNRIEADKPVEPEPVALAELEKAAVGQIPDPRSAPTKIGPGDFGFAEESVQFRNLGVGDAAAATLAKRFKPISVLNQGGMGKIILAQDLLAGRFVAVKIMLERIVGSNPHVHQFIREAVITARLQHPHIVPVYDLGFFTDNQLFYTMRYIDGKDYGKLRDYMNVRGRVRVLRCAAQAVAHAHTLGLWHRDLKPSNILVGPLGDTYVVDWGLVSVQPGKDYKLEIPKVVIEQQAIVVPDSLIDRTPEALTQTGHAGGAMGTPAYMAPEQVQREESQMGVASDVWAFGVMLYEAIAESHPFRSALSRHVGELLAAVLQAPIPPLPPDAPPALAQLCGRMLERDPKRRMAGLDEFVSGTGEFLRRNSKYV